MRGLQIIDVAPGEAGVETVRDALRRRLFDDGPAFAPVPEPSRHVSPAYAASARSAIAPAAEGAADDVAAVLTTSGSTGRPRGVLISESNLASSARLADRARPGLAACAWIQALPVTSVGGLNVVARSLLADTHLAVLPSVGGAARFDPADLLALRLPGPFAISLVPSQLRVIVDHPDSRTWLADAHTVLVGGAATDPDLLDRALTAGVPVVATYGMTETTGGCVFDGIPLPDVRVATDDDGRIRIAGPTVAVGYVSPNPGGGFATEGWFITADVGQWDGHRLTVRGRADDIVTVHGVNVAVGAIERVLVQAGGVREAAVVAVPDPVSGHRLVAHVVLDGAAEVDLDTLANVVREQLGGAARPEVHRVDALPHLPNGKIDRLALRSAST